MIFWHVGLTLFIVWFVMRGNPRADYRYAAVGAMLPDIVDKPLGLVFLREHFGTGRLYGHTLLVNVAFFAILFFMRGKRKRQLTLLPIGSLLHLAQDAMWEQPRVFWWPLFGWDMPQRDATGPLFGFLLEPLTSPGTVAMEVVGLALIVWLLSAHGLLSKQGVMAFMRTGRLEMPKEEA